MSDVTPLGNVLSFEPMPKMAQALRVRREQILSRWDQLVRDHLPDADTLTTKEVRNSIPDILDQMAKALESSDPAPADELMEITKVHGVERFHESYNIRELIIEYRMLRRVLVEEIDTAFPGTVSTREWIALDVAVDVAMQQAVLAFLENQRAKIISATEAEAKFLSFLAHDLRNGLNTITLTMSWVEGSLEAYPALAEERAGLSSARQTTLDTITSMERLLQAERIRKKSARVQRDRVQLRTIAEQVAAQARAGAIAKGLLLQVDVAPEVLAMTDAGLLTLILQNLVSNAIKYSVLGIIRIHAASPTAAAGATGTAGWLLSVSDQGPGIAPDVQRRLFDAFERGETHGQAGVGLGLYIAAQAAQALGASLSVDSELGQGSTFTVQLPA